MRTNLSSSWALFREMVRLLYRSHPRALVVGAVASLAEPLFFPVLLLLLQQLFLRLTGPSGTGQFTAGAVPIALAIVALLLIQRLGIIVHDGSSLILRQEAWVVISKQITEKLRSVPYSLFENNAFQARYGLVVREASQRSISMVDSLLSTIPILLGLTGLIITLFAIAPLMIIALLVIAFPAMRVERRFSRATYALQEESASMQLRLNALSNMLVDAIWQRDVRVYRSDLLEREHTTLAEAYLTQLKLLTSKFFRLRTAAALVQATGLGLALTVLLVLMSQGQINLASLAVIFPGVAIMFGMISSFIYQARSLMESLRYAQTLFDFLGASFESEAIHTVLPLAAPKAVSRLGAICLQDVSYVYPENQKLALTGISCEFKPGLTAIVGVNGAGKSTLVKLVAGLVSPTTGKICAVRADGESVSLKECLKAVLFQDPGHFPFSIRHNVTMRFDRLPGEDEAIIEALRQAGLWEVVQAFPDGLDTIVGAGFGGVSDLSGGQWQRLALARLLYHDAPIIILDEPSASLDPLGERQIFALLSSLAHEKIVLFTTHRYDTIRQAETIIVLTDGKLAEMGTHEALERNAGSFWSLYLS